MSQAKAEEGVSSEAAPIPKAKSTVIKMNRTKTAVALMLATALLAALAGCGEKEYTGAEPPPEVAASTLVSEYQFNRERADERYKDRWFIIKAGPALEVENGRRVRFEHQGWNVKMDFTERTDAKKIDQGDSVRAVCRVSGPAGHYIQGIWLQHCRMTDPENQP